MPNALHSRCLVGLNQFEFTETATRALMAASQEAQQLGHKAIGPEHLLLGVRPMGAATSSPPKLCGIWNSKNGALSVLVERNFVRPTSARFDHTSLS